MPPVYLLTVALLSTIARLVSAFQPAVVSWQNRNPHEVLSRRHTRGYTPSFSSITDAAEGTLSTGVSATDPAGEGGENARIIRQAMAWVRDVVVRLRLCPFAEGVFTTERGVRYVVTPAANADELWLDFLREVDHLMAHDRKEVGTTLLMVPRCMAKLEDFNDFCAWLENTIENDEVLVDQILVACFHPKHAFHGLEEDDALNYEKRSPHPTINLLRADVVDEYVAMGKTLGIAEHNERTLRSEGKGAIKAAFEDILALK